MTYNLSSLSPLKWELTPLTRLSIEAAQGVKIGDLVDFPMRPGKKLVSLTNERFGKVVVQPHNCVIDLSGLGLSQQDVQTLLRDGDPYGITYIVGSGQANNIAHIPAAPAGGGVQKTVQPATPGGAEPSVVSTVPDPRQPVAAKASQLVFFGDSTMALIGSNAAAAFSGMELKNHAVGGTQVQHTMIEAGLLNPSLTFQAAQIPAYVDSKTTVDATLDFGSVGSYNINGYQFKLDSQSSLQFVVLGQTKTVRILPNRNNKSAFPLEPGREYAILPPNGLEFSDGHVAVVATCKNNINGAGAANTAPQLKFCQDNTRLLMDHIAMQTGGRFVICTQWADNNKAYEAPAKAQLMADYNAWLKSEYGDKVFDFEAYIMGSDVWADSGIQPNVPPKLSAACPLACRLIMARTSSPWSMQQPQPGSKTISCALDGCNTNAKARADAWALNLC